MLQIIKEIELISQWLDTLPGDILKQHRIQLKNDAEIAVYILVSHPNVVAPSLKDKFSYLGDALVVDEIMDSELALDQYYSWLFQQSNASQAIDLGLRKRFNNLIDFVQAKGRTIKDPVVTTFYSYKGGMGRSTTLAAFASYCAKIHGKRVAVVDCDFEAPGFTNYFDLDSDILSLKSGVVEYLLDKQLADNSGKNLDFQANYCYKVGFEYVGKGEIFVIPAGNLSNELTDPGYNRDKRLNLTHRDHYLEALARLDLSSVDNIVQQLTSFIDDIRDQLSPDILLFDSRTGFNDTFAVLASLSKIIIGFFGNNIQNRTGLEQFLQTVGQIEADKEVLLINSNLLGGGRRYKEDFEEQVEQIIKLPQNQNKFVVEEPRLTEKEFRIYQVSHDAALQNIGTQFSYKKQASNQKFFDADFVELIENNKHFQPFFDDLFSKIEAYKSIDGNDVQNTAEINAEKDDQQSDVNAKAQNYSSSSDEVDFKAVLERYKGKVPINEMRRALLEKLNAELSRISRYADDSVPEVQDFYFRDCMKDMFNRDKFLIIGSKGTGKTALYQAFKKADLRQKLQARSNIFNDKHLFVNAISIHKEQHGERYLETTKFNIQEILDTDFFFERFWVVYVWNAVMLDQTIRESKYFSNEIPVLPITQEPDTVNRFKKYITDDEAYAKIFRVLKELDERLKGDDKNLIVLFEQLDYVVKPEYWSKGIAPLINFWRSNPFTKILPKIFLRSDLFNQLTNITNSQNLPNRSIYIEWTKEELFSYFFKLVFQNAKTEFYTLMYSHFNYSNLDLIYEIDKLVTKNDNQVLTDERYLRPLVETFFGKYANWKDGTANGMGESYDWFYRNLRDANNMISLRPFLNLIENAIRLFLKRNLYTNSKAILSASFYTDNRVREEAVKQHYEDLAKEKGNRPLLKFYQYITVDGPTRIKVPYFRRMEFNDMLNQVFMKYKGDEDLSGLNNINDLKSILLSNGIVKETDNTNRKYTNYVIPFLYRNYFRVSSRNLPGSPEKP